MLGINTLFAGRYRLIERIGLGGFSEVWKAADQMAEDSVLAIKIYAPERGMDDRGIKQFRREYAVVLNLNHPSLLTARHLDVWEGRPYLVMPYIEGGSLADKLADEVNFSESQLATLLAQMGDALAYLHGEDILHQDIKPDNILIDKNGKYILTDFGISSRLRSTLRKNTSADVSMTMAYAPPERFDAIPRNLPAGDVFSLGVLAYEMATGDVPWMGNGGISLITGAKAPHLPESFSRICRDLVHSMMNLEPDKRPGVKQVISKAEQFVDVADEKMLPSIQSKYIRENSSSEGVSEQPQVRKTQRLNDGLIGNNFSQKQKKTNENFAKDLNMPEKMKSGIYLKVVLMGLLTGAILVFLGLWGHSLIIDFQNSPREINTAHSEITGTERNITNKEIQEERQEEQENHGEEIEREPQLEEGDLEAETEHEEQLGQQRLREASNRDPSTDFASITNRTAPYSLQWEGTLNRNPMVQPLPGNRNNEVADITIRFEVHPDGSLGRVIPLGMMNPEMEREVMRTMRSWRFSRLPSGVPQESQWGTITFHFHKR